MASSSSKTAEAFIGERLVKSPAMLVPYYLMLSYLYYDLGEGLVSDEFFDRLCKDLQAHWEEIDHQHKRVVDFESLAAGTGYYLQYPLRVKCSATALWFRFHPVKPAPGPLDLAFFEAGRLVVYREFHKRKTAEVAHGD